MADYFEEARQTDTTMTVTAADTTTETTALAAPSTEGPTIMAYPPGVSLATITIGAGRTMFGAAPKLISATVTPIFVGTPHVVHTASGWAFYPSPQTFRVENGEELTFELPHVNAEGWRDTAGNEFPALLESGERDRGWAYHAKFTVIGGSGQDAIPHRYEKVFQPLVGQTGPLDLDLVPDGSIGAPVSAPMAVVSSIAGLTGPVTAEQLQALGLGGLGEEDVAALADAAADQAVLDAGTYTDLKVGDVRTEVAQAGYLTDVPVEETSPGTYKVGANGIVQGLTEDKKLPDAAKTDLDARFTLKGEASDTAVANLAGDSSSLTGAVLESRFGDQYARASILYVDPVGGNDAATGSSWKRAKKTIQAAVDAAPKGSEIVLAPGGHVVGQGVTCDDNTKVLTIRGASPLTGRQHADQSFGQTHIRSGLTGDARPSFLFRVGTPASTNIYGWTFKNLYFEAGSLLPDGACIRAHGVSRALVQDVSARCLGTAEMTRWLLKTDGGSGNDAAWWHCDRVSTYGVRFLHSRQGNYWTFNGCSIMGATEIPRADGPAMDIMGSQHNLNGLHIEGWNTGIKATGTRGLLGHGVMSEWVASLFHLVGCQDSVIIANSAAGAGASEVLDENGKNNTVIGAAHRKTGTTAQAMSVSTYGTSPTQLAANFAAPIFDNHPVRPNPGIELLPDGATDIAGSAPISAQFWNGTAWATWTGIDTAILSAQNDQTITVDETRKRCRFRTGLQYGWAQGLAYIRLTQSSGTDATVTFRSISTDDVTVVAEHRVVLDEVAQKRGAWASFPRSTSAGRIEVEVNFGITGAQTARVHRFAVFTTDVHPNVRGRQMRGAKSPVGVINGVAGDIYHNVGSGTSDPTRGWWIYDGASGTTGWVKLMPEILTSPGGTKYKLVVADDGTLSTVTA